MRTNDLFRFWSSVLLGLISIGFSGRVSADKILVVIEDGVERSDYQSLWSNLNARNHQLSFRAAKDASPALAEFGEPSFDHLILFSPTSKSFPADLSPQALVQFLEDGGNILLAGATNISEYWRDFGREFDIDFDDRTSTVIDNFHHLDSDPTTIYNKLEPDNPLIEDQIVIPTSIRDTHLPILFKGIGHAIGKNPLLMSILRASPLAYSADFKTQEIDPNPLIIGDEIGLISAFQTKKQSRIIFIGSLEFFSDQFINAQLTLPDGQKTPTGNRKVIDTLTKWVFQESGVLRIVSATHSLVNGEQEPSRYRVNDQIEYKVDVQLLQNGRWGPCPLDDLQLEFTMLDPHLRVKLNGTKSNKGTQTSYTTIFRAPDRHGVFTFKLDYRRRTGYTHLQNSIQVPVTPLDHDQYERFILAAYPYYSGTLSVLACFLLFSFVWLTHFPGSGPHKKTK
ncbi:hypothetical protein MJO28_000233 [Puccinia striiformis f. sp. tritici]|uniref:Dolichyl-diphosphooligosaccharide--protein glycosyltransferase subunit WBP1 n=4 Tax=Puccinia striiformis TaxID=27350 RepID=A0A0L0VLS6_9BASI|nr:hypothetical protein Pst134EA_000990 [Puccinia striiformis f. sp. tritici]KAI9600049.1 hypothetical protein KEM48_000264 [Puccinia striiformis f. sp. tritici PST-130]KNF00238.1 hypothetical protein PSTG_06413 [Puccinia striiformis f. sp. tritici PST-78]POV94457.1 hypothetical protein PSHT_16208 [Puccinia striiformis]KAH9467171.1 hypothetical protein Pst134EB_002195 [Puccinia striiformis f. sp. tritici]KAH9473933.1 hypothetical protein Pst134EA_000990 [Puccinia striiformis f. sp. tritici]